MLIGDYSLLEDGKYVTLAPVLWENEATAPLKFCAIFMVPASTLIRQNRFLAFLLPGLGKTLPLALPGRK